HGKVHTIDEGIRIIERVAKPNLGLLIDTYHAYIEEDDVYSAIERARDHVRYFHLHDSDRGPAGASNGVIDFDRIFRILNESRYSGYLADGLLTMELPEDQVNRSTCYLHERITRHQL
ncbi:MAG: sugar phosphate isomerase/epimerase family protein, partial [Bryobacteraceae bacterium]